MTDRFPLLFLLLSWIAVPVLATDADTGEPVPFSHADWTTVLERFVDADGMVDYVGLSRDRAVFDRYLQAIKATGPAIDPSRFHTPHAALAFYINAYNAHIFDGVLDKGPTIKSVWGALGTGFGFFAVRKIRVDGESTTLKKFEEDTILVGFRDARVHAALNCASIGCPLLRREAYVAERLDEQLDDATRVWVNDSAHVQVDHGARTVRLNKIFDWFRADFLHHGEQRGVSSPTLLDFVNHYREQPVPTDYGVAFLDYDKGLNAQGR
ncbi:MAG: DUF547 domain-containing protein [Acidobacteriota bacterium]